MPTEQDRRQRFNAAAAQLLEPLQRFIRRRAGAHLADDVLSDTLLALWRRLDDIEPGQELLWAYGTARRSLANQRRGERRRIRLAERLQAQPLSVAAGADSDPELETALGRMSSPDLEVLRLWAWERLEPREIAVVLGISANAAGVRLHRARTRLAAELGRKEVRAVGHIRREHAGEG